MSKENMVEEWQKNVDLKKNLPDGYDYHITSYQQESGGFEVELRMSIDDQSDVENWFRAFQDRSKTTFRVDKTFPNLGPKVIFKKTFRCQHNTRPATHDVVRSVKHTGCNAKVTITVKNKHMKRSKDSLLASHPTVITMRLTHNHPVYAADALRHRRPNDDVKEQIRNLFAKGHSPSSALEVLKYDLQEKYGDKYYQIAADGSLCPDLQWCYREYYKIFSKEYGASEGPEMLESLKKFVTEYNNKVGDVCATLDESDDHLIVAICSPLMKRVHQLLKASGEVVFIDSSGNMDKNNNRVFVLMAPSISGGLPLGIVITDSESEFVITKGLELLSLLFPSEAFFGKGRQGPDIFVTDDSRSLRNAIKVKYPHSAMLLCKFHVLQAFWRYIWNSSQKVLKEDRPELFTMFKMMVNSPNDEDLDEAYLQLLGSTLSQKYPNVVKYLESMMERRDEWSLAGRKNLLIRGHNTNNYSEAAFRVLKDNILHRLKAYSIVHLFDFLSVKLTSYYEQKVVHTLNNRSKADKRMKQYEAQMKFLHVEKIADDQYNVSNREKGTEYVVDAYVDTCSCPVGFQGAPCKHQYYVKVQFGLPSVNFQVEGDMETKTVFHKILTGSHPEDPNWYKSLRSSSEGPNNPETSCLDNTMPAIQNTEDEELSQPSSSYQAEHGLEVSDTKRMLSLAFKKIEDSLEANEELAKSVSKFASNVLKMSDSNLSSFLVSSGKYGGPVSGRRKINVQPTAVARRTTYLGGRNIQHTGRPSKAQRLPEHAYALKRRNLSTWAELPTPKRKAAPHALNTCVERNIALGKTHHKKSA